MLRAIAQAPLESLHNGIRLFMIFAGEFCFVYWTSRHLRSSVWFGVSCTIVRNDLQVGAEFLVTISIFFSAELAKAVRGTGCWSKGVKMDLVCCVLAFAL
jgi:hypothetical protein